MLRHPFISAFITQRAAGMCRQGLPIARGAAVLERGKSALPYSLKIRIGICCVCIHLYKQKCLAKLNSTAITQPGFNPSCAIGSLGTCMGTVPESAWHSGCEGPGCGDPLFPAHPHGGPLPPSCLGKITASGKLPRLLSLLPQHG